jgi:glyoxylase-like metal-dependent hydrolase (beta-lactamase superfamily II)
VTGSDAREVLAVRYCNRTTTRAENFLNHHLYGEPDADIEMDYYFWVVRDGAGTILVDTGFNPAAGDRRRRAWWTTPADALPTIGVDPG